MTVDTEWMRHAACNGLDPELFFPSRGEDLVRAKAKAVCNSCPVRLPCLEYALTVPATNTGTYVIGVWGGTSEKERRNIRASITRKQKQNPTSRRYPHQHGTLHGYRRHQDLNEKPCWWCQDIAERNGEGRSYGKDAS